MSMIGSRVSVAVRSGCCSALPPRPVFSSLQRRISLQPLHAKGSRSTECASSSNERVAEVESSCSSSSSEDHTFSPLAESSSSTSSPLPLLAFTLLTTAALASICAQPSAAAELHNSLHPVPLFDLSESGEEFWPNVVRYGRYFVTVMLGTGYVMLKPIAGMFKNPASAVLGIALVVGAVVGTKVTLEAMLGVSAQVEYQSSNFM